MTIDTMATVTVKFAYLNILYVRNNQAVGSIHGNANVVGCLYRSAYNTVTNVVCYGTNTFSSA